MSLLSRPGDLDNREKGTAALDGGVSPHRIALAMYGYCHWTLAVITRPGALHGNIHFDPERWKRQSA